MAYEVNGQTVEHDEEGYITTLSDWSKELADVIAESENIDMNEGRRADSSMGQALSYFTDGLGSNQAKCAKLFGCLSAARQFDVS